ncbi:DUF883 family protein [Methyloligella sp. 2.7D]|uniref:DUF883 family protein n=1 Tax=unclassified Methyloligella TaxID=2625955 RepID=UPI00157C83FD|nr:DUF883 family protein [Methyloligella sp. GL2]QKP77349.1 DUF883 family protein [Methyloligella sp. GL2]
MSDNDMRSTAKKTAAAAGVTDAEIGELSDHIASIREEIQGLKDTVSGIANRQMGRAQDKAKATATEAEDAIRRNPLQAIAIAAGLGFLFGVFTRR